MSNLPPLREEGKGHKYKVDDIVPRHIVASAAHQFGVPVLKQTRLPVETIAARVKAGDDFLDVATDYELSYRQVLLAVCFQAGVDWQKSGTRRKRMDKAVKQYWASLKAGLPDFEGDRTAI